MKYCFVKLNYHAEPNHPAKYGGPGVHRLKVSFYRHNGMSLIFKNYTSSVLVGNVEFNPSSVEFNSGTVEFNSTSRETMRAHILALP